MKLSAVCKHCYKFYGDHRASDDACPREYSKGRHQGFHYGQKFEEKK